MSSSSTRMPTPEGRGSVSGAPDLPAGFADTFIPGSGHYCLEEAPDPCCMPPLIVLQAILDPGGTPGLVPSVRCPLPGPRWRASCPEAND